MLPATALSVRGSGNIRKTYQPGSQVVGKTDLIAEEPASEQSPRQEEGPSSQVVPAPSSVRNEIGPQPLTTEIDEYSLSINCCPAEDVHTKGGSALIIRKTNGGRTTKICI
jgi:hypothetical protein